MVRVVGSEGLDGPLRIFCEADDTCICCFVHIPRIQAVMAQLMDLEESRQSELAALAAQVWGAD